MSDKLYIKNEMAQLDRKNRRFYDELTDEEKKKFSTYLMIRWGSAIKSVGGLSFEELSMVQKFYVEVMNMRVNKHFFDLGKHPKLQWLLLTTVSPSMGTLDHEWIAFKGKASKDKRANLLAKIYPDVKMQDLETLAKTLPDEDIKRLLIDLGWRDKEIKEALK